MRLSATRKIIQMACDCAQKLLVGRECVRGRKEGGLVLRWP